MPTDTDKKLNGTPEPFRRPMAWGRPPPTVFRAGPLPTGTGLPPRPQQPRMPVGPGILTGSMIPRATPGPAPEAAPTPAPSVPVPATVPARSSAKATVARPAGQRETPAAAAAPIEHAADLTVRALPALQSERAAPAAAQHGDALTAAQPVVTGEVANAAGQRPQGPASARRITNPMPLYAGIAVAALAVLALGAWIWTRPAKVPPPEAAVAAAETMPSVPVPAIIPAETLPRVVAAEAAVTPEPATPGPGLRPATPLPAAVRPPAVGPRPIVSAPTPAPRSVAPPPAVVTIPLIAVAPAPAPQPTAAERPQTDPDAPVTTRPQPISPGEEVTTA